MIEKLRLITSFYREAFAYFDAQKSAPEIEVKFYPYVGINHTIRVRGGAVFVRIAEMCAEMPMNAQKALAYILVAKLLRRGVPARARQIYSAYAKTPELRDRAVEHKRARGRKIITSPRGAHYDLETIFDDLNERYFRRTLPKPVLSWSAKKTYRILGHHDSTHRTIVVSKSLDEAKIPKYVVEFVVFHEMLHIYHPTEHRDGRRFVHTPEFRRSEKKFQHYERAEKWIENNIKSLKRAAKQKPARTENRP